MANSKYDPSFCARAFQLMSEGLREVDLAKVLGVSPASIANYKLAHPEFAKAIKDGKKPTDTQVEGSVAKAARGYDYEEREYERNAKGRMVLKKITVKHKPADATLAKFWLINRKPTEWRDKQDHDHAVKVSISHEDALKELE